MSDLSWSSLAAPFPASSLRWHAIGCSDDGLRVRLAPHLALKALRRRLDETVGPDGWSFELRAWTPSTLIAELTVRGVSRAAVAQVLDRPGLGEDDTIVAAAEAATGAAMTAAAALFGATPPARVLGDAWVDADPGSGDALHPPPFATSETEADAAPGLANPPGGAPVADGPAEGESKPEPHQVIDRLVERLREEGLGGEAAKLVSRYGGYGADVAESRELYAKLRSLLLQRSGAG